MAFVKHGQHKTKLYRVWLHMRDRCRNPRHPNWGDYGGRGITICPEWDSFVAFREWALEHGYEEGLEIDREKNDSGYSPDNCRFVTHIVNSNNTRKVRNLELFGESKSVSAWLRDDRCVVTRAAFYFRLNAGWSALAALTKPAHMGLHRVAA